MADPKPWIETPCVYSAAISRTAGCNVYLKLEFLQPSGSFKSRGIGHYIVRAAARARARAQDPLAPPDVHLFCSSGGNAGLACATAAREMGLPATIVVPESTTAYMVDKLRTAGAAVHQSGANWAAADRYLRDEVMPGHTASGLAVYVPPFDHPDIWAGASTIVDELAVQLPGGRPPDAIVCSVGGGGLLCGLMEGVARAGWLAQTAVVAVETEGADSLAQSVAAGQRVTLPGITSIATSLGAVRVAEQAFVWTQRFPGAVVPVVVSDGDAVEGMVRLLEEARILVEPACSAAVAAVAVPGAGGAGSLRGRLGAGLSDEAWAAKNVVLVVCGGSNINLAMLGKYREQFGR